ncbi:hypothetical protein Tco_0055504 [Tanacetum coccineum]
MNLTNEDVQKSKHFFCSSCSTSRCNTNMLFGSSSVPPSSKAEVQKIKEEMEHMQQRTVLLKNQTEQHRQAIKENNQEMRELDARRKEMHKWIKVFDK